MPMQTLALFVLGMVAAGGVGWVFIYPLLSGERQAEKRQALVSRLEPAARAAGGRGGPKQRRDQVEESL
jgi:tight adherence protein B